MFDNKELAYYLSKKLALNMVANLPSFDCHDITCNLEGSY